MVIYSKYKPGDVLKLVETGKHVVVETIYATVTKQEKLIEYTVAYVDGGGKEDVEQGELEPLKKKG